jgi:hypothetical protein
MYVYVSIYYVYLFVCSIIYVHLYICFTHMYVRTNICAHSYVCICICECIYCHVLVTRHGVWIGTSNWIY